MKNSINNKIKIIAFLAMLCLPLVIWKMTGIFSPETVAKLDFDLGEKREKTQMSSILELRDSGDTLTSYVSDHAPFRSVLIDFYHEMDAAVEKPYNDAVPKLSKLFYGKYNAGSGNHSSQDAYNNLFMNQGELFSPNFEEPDFSGHTYEVVEDTESTCQEYGRVVYVCTDCGESYVQNKPLAEHDLMLAGEVAATYTEWGKKIYFCSVCSTVIYDITEEKLIDTSYFAPVEKNGVIFGRYNWLFYAEENSLDYYKGNNLMSESEMSSIADKLAKLQDVCDQKGIELGIIVVPNKDQVYPEYMPSYNVETEYKRTARLVDYIAENTEVAITYPLEELMYAGRFFDTYMPYDTHWNGAGAYVGLMSLYDKMGYKTYDPIAAGVEPKDPIPAGDLMNMVGLNPKDYPPMVDYSISYLKDVHVYPSSEDVNVPIYYGNTDNKNGKKLFFVGDSFRVAMTDYVVKNYSEFCVVHRDSFFNAKDYFLDGSNVIIIEVAERYDSYLSLLADYLIDSLTD